jgi:hypothetical protein
MGLQGVGRRESAALVSIVLLVIALVTLNGSTRQSAAQTSQTEIANTSVEIKFSVKGRKSCPESFCKKGGAFNSMNVRFISISSDDEMRVFFFHSFDPSIRIRVGENRAPQQTISFPIAVPLEGWEVGCENEVQKCDGTLSIVGTIPDAG